MGKCKFQLGHAGNDRGNIIIQYLLYISEPFEFWNSFDGSSFTVDDEQWHFRRRPTRGGISSRKKTIFLSSSFEYPKPFKGSRAQLKSILSAAKQYIDAYETKAELRKQLDAYKELGTVEELTKLAATKEVIDFHANLGEEIKGWKPVQE